MVSGPSFFTATVVRTQCSHPAMWARGISQSNKSATDTWLRLRACVCCCVCFCRYLTFVAPAAEVEGSGTEHELKPGGKDLDVTDANKREYVSLRLDHTFNTSRSANLDSLERGFRAALRSPTAAGGAASGAAERAAAHAAFVAGAELIETLEPGELGTLLRGAVELDVGDWKRHASLTRSAATVDARRAAIVAEWFWQAVGAFSASERLRLLTFVTAMAGPPAGGFAALEPKFALRMVADRDLVPAAHSCFNILDLPALVPSQAELERRLRICLAYGDSFDMA